MNPAVRQIDSEMRRESLEYCMSWDTLHYSFMWRIILFYFFYFFFSGGTLIHVKCTIPKHHSAPFFKTYKSSPKDWSGIPLTYRTAEESVVEWSTAVQRRLRDFVKMLLNYNSSCVPFQMKPLLYDREGVSFRGMKCPQMKRSTESTYYYTLLLLD